MLKAALLVALGASAVFLAGGATQDRQNEKEMLRRAVRRNIESRVRSVGENLSEHIERVGKGCESLIKNCRMADAKEFRKLLLESIVDLQLAVQSNTRRTDLTALRMVVTTDGRLLDRDTVVLSKKIRDLEWKLGEQEENRRKAVKKLLKQP